jgi:hypothetical protein
MISNESVFKLLNNYLTKPQSQVEDGDKNNLVPVLQ